MGFCGLALPSASAGLPSLAEKKWLGHFIGVQNRKFSYGLTVYGKSVIKVAGLKDEPLPAKLAIQVDFLVEEILPNGKTYIRQILPETLGCTQPAGNYPKNVVIRGKVKGDASFEVSVHEDRGLISLGGRLLDKGTLVKNPVRFSIRMKFPSAYASTKRDLDKKQKAAFEQKTRQDRMAITWTDGKRFKQATDQVVDARSKDVNGPGISALQVEFSSFLGKKIGCVASANSVIILSNRHAGPLHDGFVLTWVSDSANDPGGLARLSFEVK